MSFREASRRVAAANKPALLPAVDAACNGMLDGTLAGRGAEVQLFRPHAGLHTLVEELGSLGQQAVPSAAARRLLLLSSCAVAVVRAWLTAVTTIPHPGVFEGLALDTVAESRRGRVPLADAEAELQSRLLSTEIPALGPHRAWAEIDSSLKDYFTTVFDAVSEFARSVGTSNLWQKEPRPEHEAWVKAGTAIALTEWRSWFRTLAMSNAELLFWADLLAAPAEYRVPADGLPAPIKRLDGALESGTTGLRTISEVIEALDPPPQRDSPLSVTLIELAQADFQRAVIDPTENAISPDLTLPALCDVYVNPLCRTASSSPKARPFDHLWWRDDTRLRADIESFLAGCLTFPAAFERPLVVLGDPGAGKTVLLRGLAAAATAGAWLPIMVRLRHVPSSASLLTQVESALHETLKRPVHWADLVEQSSGRTPLLLLDGFDELLQTTSTNRADYLEEIRRFQESEATAGRRVAVVVTTRTAMAHSARIPDDSVVLRIEPLDRPRAQRWLFNWNESISDYLVRRSLRRLDIDTVWRHKDIACQPLLLLLLALHDAVDNEIQHVSGAISQGDLYERLLFGFVEREMHKRHPSDSAAQRRRRVEAELDLLSYTSFAIFNRASQSISETQLQADLTALTNPADPPATGDEDTDRLMPAQLLLGRFFFIHESLSTGSVGDSTVRLRTYEFLHATFWEYLIARLTVKATRGLAFGASGLDDSGPYRADGRLLPALLSFRPLTVRGKILEFAAESFRRFVSDPPGDLTAALTRQLHSSLADPMASAFVDYSPAPADVVRRLACLSHNLVCLVAVIGPPLIDVRALRPQGADEDPVGRWRQLGFVWRAGMDDGAWRSAQEGLVTVRIGECEAYFGLADRLAAGREWLASMDVVARLRDAPEPLTSYEVPDVRRLLAPYLEIQRNGMLAPPAHRAGLAAALLQLMGVDPATGSTAQQSTVSYRDADYLDCIAAAYDVPPAGRRMFVATVAHQLEREQRNLRNRDLIQTLIQLATVEDSDR